MRTLLASLTLLATVGCAGSFNNLLGSGGNEMVWSKVRAARYDGPECSKVIYPLSEEDKSGDYNAKPTTKDDAPASQILLAVCTRHSTEGTYGHEIPEWPRIASLDPTARYLATDDLHLDVVAAALEAVVISNGRSFSNWQKAPEAGDDFGKALDGVALVWAHLLTPDQVAQAVAPLNLPAAAKAAFVTQFRAVPQRLKEAAFSPAEHALLIDLPVKVFQDRQAHFAKFKADYAALDGARKDAQATRAGADVKSSIAELEKLRAAFMAHCGEAACRGMPLYGWATMELAQLHVLDNDVLGAEVESLLQSRPGSYVAGFPQAVRVAQVREERAIADAYQKYQRAKQNGADEATARRLAGGMAERLDTQPLEATTELPNYAAALPGSNDVRETSQIVAHVARAGSSSKVSFKVDTIHTEDAYDCVQTNRITRINYDGTIEYEEKCKYRPVSYKQQSHPPVLIPSAEAQGVRAGDVLTFVAQGDHARVLKVSRKDKVVQVRGDNVP